MEATSSELFTPPQAIVAQSAHITSVEGDYSDHSITNITNIHPASPRDLSPRRILVELKEYISEGAAHDSYERGGLDAPKCHPETRTAIQGQIMSWIGYGDQDEKPTCVMWLSGPAGSGKTAIAGSVADACQEKGWLAGSFFFSAFSGPPDRRSKRCVIPTLAYHLAQQRNIPGIRERILSAIADSPSVFEKRLREQIEILILGPLRTLPPGVDRSSWPKVIVIDGLDECGPGLDYVAEGGHWRRRSKEESHREIVSILMRASRDPAFPFRIIIVSRPEPAIRHAISTSSEAALSLFLDEKYDPDADIALFLVAAFGEIRRRFSLPEIWPSQEDIDTLVKRASGQFIYAATVIRFVRDGKRSPTEQLRSVLEWKTLGTSEAFSPLDLLYRRIIETSPNPPLAVKWLLTMEAIKQHTALQDGWLIGGLLESSPGEMDHLLGDLTSLIKLDPDQDGRAPSLTFYHQSLSDCLSDKTRSAALRDLLYSVEGMGDTKRILKNFVDDRMYQVIKHRGSQGTLSTRLSDSDTRTLFARRLCNFVPDAISARDGYDASDVDWWWSNHFYSRDYQGVEWIYARVHKDCGWYCLHGCKVWRKGIRRHCKALGGWRMPSMLDRLREKFNKGLYEDNFLDTVTIPHPYPLRPLDDGR